MKTLWVIPLVAIAAMSLACGCGGSDSSSTSPLPDQASLDWNQCAGSGYLASTAGMSCDAADRFISNKALGKSPSGGRPVAILKSDPRNFTAEPFQCTNFPLVNGGGWHVLCNDGRHHVSFYLTP